MGVLRNQLSSLEDLSLHCVRMGPRVVCELAASLPRLRSLSLHWSGGPEGGAPLELATLPPMLTSLDISGHVKVRVQAPVGVVGSGSGSASRRRHMPALLCSGSMHAWPLPAAARHATPTVWLGRARPLPLCAVQVGWRLGL